MWQRPSLALSSRVLPLAIDENTKAVHLESIGNPKYNVPDFEAIVKVAYDAEAPVIVRNPTPCEYSDDLESV